MAALPPDEPNNNPHLKQQERAAELAKFDQYVLKFYKPDEPGGLKWIYDTYPEFIERQCPPNTKPPGTSSTADQRFRKMYVTASSG